MDFGFNYLPFKKTFNLIAFRGGRSGCAGCAIAHPLSSQMVITISMDYSTTGHGTRVGVFQVGN